MYGWLLGCKMARIDGIRMRLENWARWCARNGSGGLGYPSVNMLARMCPTVGGRESFVPTDDVEASQTQDAVNSLQLRRSHLYLVLTLHYAKGLEIKRVAKHMCKAESTIKRNLEDADHALQDWLVEKARFERDRAAKK
jgi:hypothetical protein